MADTALEDQHLPGKRNAPIGGDVVRTEPYRRRVRGVVGHTTVVDTTESLMLFEAGHLPVLYFPSDAVPAELLRRSDKHTTCPRKGEASYWDLVVGDRVVPDAVWAYEEPIDGREDIKGYLAFYWRKLDHWYEEDDEVFVHVRDPYHRVDVLNSSRNVRVERDGVVLAESDRPRFLFETSLPTRTYLPLADVNQDLLEASDTTTQCPYKRVASYYSIRVGDELVPDLAWTYRYPIPELPKVEGLVAFYDEHVDVYVDGVLQTRPETPWSKRR
jgi:uncharacterized protein (DUF427 family)